MKDLLKEPTPPWEERVKVGQNGAYTIERVRTQWDFGLEGYYLAHCLGTKDAEEFNRIHRVFSIREADSGIPHATILTVKKGRHSPYGQCSDMGSHKTFKVKDELLRILQVRGREDAYAKPEFIEIASLWYIRHGGRMKIPLRLLMLYASRKGDDDDNYHYQYWLDESVNSFQWASYNEEIKAAAKKAGVSL